jgi:hypothetical protein
LTTNLVVLGPSATATATTRSLDEVDERSDNYPDIVILRLSNFHPGAFGGGWDKRGGREEGSNDYYPDIVVL